MGSNEFGLNIGNEAVFTKEKKGASELTGMDRVETVAMESLFTNMGNKKLFLGLKNIGTKSKMRINRFLE